MVRFQRAGVWCEPVTARRVNGLRRASRNDFQIRGDGRRPLQRKRMIVRGECTFNVNLGGTAGKFLSHVNTWDSFFIFGVFL